MFQVWSELDTLSVPVFESLLGRHQYLNTWAIFLIVSPDFTVDDQTIFGA